MSDQRRSDGEYRGWADRVAEGLARAGNEVSYANLAVRGKLLDQVVTDQVPVALSYAPDIVTFHAGPNDVLRRGTDLDDLFQRYDAAVKQVTESAPRVVTFTAIPRAGGSGRLAELLAARIGAFNENARRVSARHSTTLVDMGDVPALTDRRLWASDRLHLNADGHARVAAMALQSLGITDPSLLGGTADWWREPLPPRDEHSRLGDLADDAAWVVKHLVPWVSRRLRGVSSGDGREPKDPRPRPVTARPS